MKNIFVYLSVFATIGVLVLGGMQLTASKSSNSKKAVVAEGGSSNASTNVAFVDIDSFQNNYTFLKAKREEFNKRQSSMQIELERSAQQLQSNAQAFQQKVQAGTISQSEGEATQRKLVQMQESLRLREQALTEQLLKEKDEFNEQLHNDLDAFLKEYNKDKKYDYILSYSKVGSPILLGSDALNITEDVIKGMNEQKKEKADKTKKKK